MLKSFSNWLNDPRDPYPPLAHSLVAVGVQSLEIGESRQIHHQFVGACPRAQIQRRRVCAGGLGCVFLRSVVDDGLGCVFPRSVVDGALVENSGYVVYHGDHGESGFGFGSDCGIGHGGDDRGYDLGVENHVHAFDRPFHENGSGNGIESVRDL